MTRTSRSGFASIIALAFLAACLKTPPPDVPPPDQGPGFEAPATVLFGAKIKDQNGQEYAKVMYYADPASAEGAPHGNPCADLVGLNYQRTGRRGAPAGGPTSSVKGEFVLFPLSLVEFEGPGEAVARCVPAGLTGNFFAWRPNFEWPPREDSTPRWAPKGPRPDPGPRPPGDGGGLRPLCPLYDDNTPGTVQSVRCKNSSSSNGSFDASPPVAYECTVNQTAEGSNIRRARSFANNNETNPIAYCPYTDCPDLDGRECLF